MRKQFERESANPLYLQVISKIEKEIADGRYIAGKRLPSEMDLCKKYDVSRITIRKAMEELVSKGVVVRKQGKGTFVSKEETKESHETVTGFHDAARNQGKVPISKVITAKTIPASPMDIRKLKLPERSRMVEIKRVDMADGIPVIYEINHFSMVYSYLLENELSGSLYQLISQYGIEPGKVEREISLVHSDSQVSEALGIEENTSLMYIYEMVYDQKGRPLHTSKLYIRGDLFTVKI